MRQMKRIPQSEYMDDPRYINWYRYINLKSYSFISLYIWHIDKLKIYHKKLVKKLNSDFTDIDNDDWKVVKKGMLYGWLNR